MPKNVKVNTIKGYLPLQISFPPTTEDSTTTTTTTNIDKKDGRSTFLYLKRHVATTTENNNRAPTLFVANAPFYPSIRTCILLRCIFEKFGDVEKVVVASTPKKRNADTNNDNTEDEMVKLFERELKSHQSTSTSTSTYYGMSPDEHEYYDGGRFAHVTFSTMKDLENVWNGIGKSGGCVALGRLELRELEDVSRNKWRREVKVFRRGQRRLDPNYDSDDEEEEGSNTDSEDEEGDRARETVEPGIPSLLQIHKNRIPPRSALKLLCNKIISNYEDAESRAREETNDGEPDADGFVTVSYSTAVGDKITMEERGLLGSTGGRSKNDKNRGDDGKVGGRRRNKRERSRSAKDQIVKGNEELKDFYRFQLKEKRKRSMVELKARFEEDLRRVKKMKEEKMYRPF